MWSAVSGCWRSVGGMPGVSGSMPTRPPWRMSVGACVLVAAVVVVAGTQLLLFGPSPDVGHATLACGSEVHLAGGRSYPFNCDSNRFLGLAHHPDRLLRKNELRQSRPGYVALGCGIDGPGRFGREASGSRSSIRAERQCLFSGDSDQRGAAHRGGMLARVPAATTRRATENRYTRLVCVLVMNDVPRRSSGLHIADVHACSSPWPRSRSEHGRLRVRPGWRTLTVLGFVIGLVSLCYASVLITVAVLAVILLMRGR